MNQPENVYDAFVHQYLLYPGQGHRGLLIRLYFIKQSRVNLSECQSLVQTVTAVGVGWIGLNSCTLGVGGYGM